MRTYTLALLCLLPMMGAFSQTPEVTSWITNTDGDTGFGGILTNVQQVQYSNDNVYVTTTCIPGYDIGPWAGNPNTAANQNFVFRITRTPQENTGNKTATALGHIGVWTNGVSIFNADDGMSYNNANVWNRDALFWEGSSFDNCLGHPAPNGEYHHHVNPVCLYDASNSTEHSPIIGYAFDGFPIYGAYGYANTDGTGVIKRMETSYRHKNLTSRTNGPAINAQYPLGAFLEDNEYVQGLGDLDEHNGRFCITPDYPQGIYAYFVTINDNLEPAYPYVLGPQYYGVVVAGNTGPQSGHTTPLVGETVVTYVQDTTTSIGNMDALQYPPYPNPTTGQVTIDVPSGNAMALKVYNSQGQLVMDGLLTAGIHSVQLSSLPAGVYMLRMEGKDGVIMKRVIKN